MTFEFEGQAFEHIEQSIKNKTHPMTMARDPYWMHAFAFYNSSNDIKYQMNCVGCYVKVYLWHKKQREEQPKRWSNAN